MNKVVKDIWNAIKGESHDYTKISLGKAILYLSIPMVFEMMMESLFAIIDIFFVSKLGSEAITIVGLTESLMTIVYAIGIGLSMATTGLVARRIGEDRDIDASIASAQAIITGILISLFIAIPGLIFTKKILTLMNAEPDVISIGSSFTSIMIGGNVFIMLLFINNAIFRSAGSPAIAMRVLLFANLINIILDPLLIFGLGPFPKFGVQGAAIATNIGRGSAVFYQFYLLIKGSSRIKIMFSTLKIRLHVMFKLIYLSGGGIAQHIVATSSWIFLYRILAEYKNNVIAGYTIALRILVFFFLPAWGFSNAASTLVGQNLGACHPKRAEKAVWRILLITSFYMLIMSLLFYFVPEFFVKFFKSNDASFEVSVRSLQIVGLGMVMYGFEIVFAQAFNGAGDTYTPTILNIIGFWIIEIPLAYYLAKIAGYREDGVFWSIVISESIIAIMSFIVFFRGKWKSRIV